MFKQTVSLLRKNLLFFSDFFDNTLTIYSDTPFVNCLELSNLERGMYLKKIIACIAFAVLAALLPAQTFRFSQQQGDQYRIVAEVTEGVFLDDQLLGESSILNRIAVMVTESDESGGTLSVRYSISEKSLDTGVYIYSAEDAVEFYRYNNGEYGDIPEQDYLPSVRNVPVFPDSDLEPGDSWSAMAEEVHDLKPFFDIDYRLHIPFRVFYTYKGKDTYQGREVDVILINYHLYSDVDVFSLPPGALPSGTADLPNGVYGDFEQTFFWDSRAGIPAYVTDRFSISYTMDSGHRYTFRGISEGKVTEADQWEKKSVKEEIETVLEDEHLEDISVEISDEGVTLTLENILFVPDEAEFLPGEEDKLKDIGRIISRFPDHDLLITGHTAFVGARWDGQQLSERRAGAVAEYFMNTGIKDSSQMVIKGMGHSMPVADNSTEEGKRKNRRVEITILDN